MPGDMVPCARCGRRRQVSKSLDKRRRSLNLCVDCRTADPDYVRAVTEGVKIA